VAKVLRLGAISPAHLNLNGDLGNLVVLRKRLELRGVQSEIVSLNGYEDLQEFDFILVGHGSKSAWEQLLASVPDLFARISDFARHGGAVMAVASAADLLQPLLTGVEVEFGNWVSEFVESEGVVGYLNTTSKAPLVEWFQNSLLTQLHGPVLAKNPDLANEIIARNNWVHEVIASEELDELDELAKQSRRIAFEH
jgi:CobQ-like glutamine amidotransferase family enzyme